jgi:flavodoxin
MQNWLKQIPAGALEGKHVAAFDTRLTGRWVRIFGFAAGRIASSLENKGGNLAMPGEGFFVTGGEGPLKEGDLERAADWAREVVAAAQ